MPEALAHNARQMQVSNQLKLDLDRFLRNYRTFDRRELTEGEVIVGIGFLLGQRLKSTENVQRWIQQIAIAGLDAAKGESK